MTSGSDAGSSTAAAAAATFARRGFAVACRGFAVAFVSTRVRERRCWRAGAAATAAAIGG